MTPSDFLQAIDELRKAPSVDADTFLTLGGAYHELLRLRAKAKKLRKHTKCLEQRIKNANDAAALNATADERVRTDAVDAIADDARIPLRSGGLLVLHRNEHGRMLPITVVVTGRQTRKATETAIQEANALTHLLFDVVGGFEIHQDGTITWDDIPF